MLFLVQEFLRVIKGALFWQGVAEFQRKKKDISEPKIKEHEQEHLKWTLSGISYDPARWCTSQSRGLYTFRIQTVYYNLDPTIYYNHVQRSETGGELTPILRLQ